MKIIEVEKRTNGLIKQLVALWERSVRATHLFLSEAEILQIKKYVPQALAEIPILIVAVGKDGEVLAFMGIAERKLEMFFVDDAKRGQGVGRKLLEFGFTRYNVNEVTVNEQNPQAKAFYELMGFTVYKRSDSDEQGQPYPLLYMKK